jgi:small subunit ribosomal protein S16
MTDPAKIVIDEEKALKWLRTGAQPSDTAKSLMSKAGVWEKFINEKLGRPIPGPEAEPTLSPEVAPGVETEDPTSAEEVTGEATVDSAPESTSEGAN